MTGNASAAVVVEIDLSVTDQVTISSTAGLSAISTSGSDDTGIYFENFYSGPGSSLADTLLSGNFTSANNVSDSSPDMWRGGSGADTGLNMWSWTADGSSSFTAGSVAFSGSASFSLDAASYADMVAGSASGNLFFPADTAGDITGLTAIGTWRVRVSEVPIPAAAWLFGSALLGLGAMKRKKGKC
jgi:hypothetical protein